MNIFFCFFFPFPSSSPNYTYFTTTAAFDTPLRIKFKTGVGSEPQNLKVAKGNGEKKIKKKPTL